MLPTPKILLASIIYFSKITGCNRPPQRPKGPLKVGGGGENYRKEGMARNRVAMAKFKAAVWARHRAELIFISLIIFIYLVLRFFFLRLDLPQLWTIGRPCSSSQPCQNKMLSLFICPCSEYKYCAYVWAQSVYIYIHMLYIQ